MINLLMRYMRPYRVAVFLVILFVFLQSLSDLYLPTLLADIVDHGVVNGDTPYIWRIGGLMLLIALGGAVCSIFASYLSAKSAGGFGRDLRSKLFAHVEKFSLNEFDRIGTASLITRTTNDITQLQQVITIMMRVMVMAPLMCFGGIIMALSRDARLSTVIIAIVPVIAVVILLISLRTIPLFQTLQKRLDRLNLVLREHLTGIRVIRAFNRTRHEQARFTEANRSLTDTAIQVNRMMAAMMPLMMLIINIASIAIIWYGGIRIDNGGMEVGDLMAFIQYAWQIMFALMFASMMFVMIPRASASAARIQEVLNLQPDIVDAGAGGRTTAGSAAAKTSAAAVGGETAQAGGLQAEADRLQAGSAGARTVQAGKPQTNLDGTQAAADKESALRPGSPADASAEHGERVKRGTIEFRDVSFRYPGAEMLALEHISFKAEPGEVTAIIGGTGSGKSTMLNLIPRFYDVSEGAVMIDGADVREMPQQSLRSLIGLVPQKALLFTGTIEDNIRFGREEATEEEVRHAAEIAQAAEFIAKMPDGYQSVIAQGGTNVSGGQKQRLSIARALVRKPSIYLFDDSFSALDFKTDAKLRAALRPETTDAAVLIVAQRVSTVMDADRIIVLEEGRIAGIGTHRELLENNAVYREIVASQLSEEEIA